MEMERQTEGLQTSLNLSMKSEPKSPLRHQYLAESKVIQKKLGNIEEIRHELGLSRRKMCQLLMVDPSAWTRWQKSGSVPPTIYRSLQWYMALIEKSPEWHPQNSFNRITPGKEASLVNEIGVLKKRIKMLEMDIDKTNQQAKSSSFLLLLGLLFGGLLSFGVFYWLL